MGERLLRDEQHLCRVLHTPFSDEQLAVVTAPLEPGVVVAGAGSGKTAVMTARVVWLVGTGQVDPSSVLGLTFTNKAAAELGARVRAALRELAVDAYGPQRLETRLEEHGEPTVSTYHAYAGALIAEHGLRLGIEPDLRVVTDASRYQLAARVVASSPATPRRLSNHLPTVINDLLALDAQLRDHLVDVARVRQFDAEFAARLGREKPLAKVLEALERTRAREELLDLVEELRAAKADAGLMEFSDAMAAGARLAIECPDVSAAERARFGVVLLDEYQDTSVSQRRMLQGLFSGTTALDGLGHPVTAVGDPCQAIYGWRGASVDNIDQFPGHFPRADRTPATRHHLTVNRRCDVRILQAANELAAPLYALHAGAEPLRPRAGAASGRIRLALHESVADEVGWIPGEVSRIRSALEGGDQPVSWADIAVLVRDRNELADVAGGLRSAGIPAEVVGLSGLLVQPEVGEVLATLRVVSDLTANAAVLRLLTGPRWRIGVRDLALLGERSHDLVRGDRTPGAGLTGALDAAVRGVDLTDVESLSDALADPGAKAYSEAARERFARLSAELTGLRRHAGDPLTDFVRRVVDVLGLDVELAAAPGPGADQACDNLALLLDTVAEFAVQDPFASVHGLLAYLDAEAEFGAGLNVAEPSASDSVKLLTVHTAKGLEWRAVLLPFLADGVFPSRQGRPRWQWRAGEVPWPLRGDSDALPELAGWRGKDLDLFAQACRDQSLLEERRLAYVALTRAKELVVASGHWWGRTQKTPRGPSPYLRELQSHVDLATEAGPWVDLAPPAGAVNPVLDASRPVSFPARLDQRRLDRRRLAAEAVRAALSETPDDSAAELSVAAGLDLARLDAEIEALLTEAAADEADVVEVELPGMLSATTVLRLHRDPDGLARELARPMPRAPSAASRYGTRFHAWVESHFGQQPLLDPTDLPGRADTDIADDADLRVLVDAFRSGPYADSRPHAIEAPFSLLLAGRVVRGRIDAVYETPNGFDVVDWKTNRRHDADPLQLAIYRLAWAETHGLPLQAVGAAFYYVRTGEVVRPTALPGRSRLEAVVSGPAGFQT